MVAVAKPARIIPRTPLQQAVRDYRQNTVSPYGAIRNPARTLGTAAGVNFCLSLSTQNKFFIGTLLLTSIYEFGNHIKESFQKNGIVSGIMARVFGLMNVVIGSAMFLSSNLLTAGKGFLVGTLGLIVLGGEKVSRMIKKGRAIKNIELNLDEETLGQFLEALKEEGISAKDQIRLLKKLIPHAEKYDDGSKFYRSVAKALMPEIKPYLKEMNSAKRKIVVALLNRRLEQIGMKGVKI